jgi:GGDEF domain-containing protein
MDALRRILPATTGRAVDARALGAFVTHDDEVAARLEGYVNLFFTRFDGRIAGGERALRVAGGQVAALVVLLDAVARLVDGRLPPTAAGLLWSDALATGVAARALAQVDRSADPDVVFAAGVCAGLGAMLLLIDDAEGQLTWWREVRRARGSRRRAAAERLFEADPRIQAARALDVLGVPEALLDVIAVADPEALAEGWQPAGRVLARALSLVEALGASDSGPALAAWTAATTAEVSMSEEGSWRLIQSVLETTPQAGRALGLPCAPRRDLHALRSRDARPGAVSDPEDLRVLVALQDAVIDGHRRESAALAAAMTERVRTDPITELSTFQIFVGRLDAALADPGQHVAALVTIDVVDFGVLFAHEGLRTSDQVLARIAGTLARTFTDADLLARVGPATFAVAVPGSLRLARIQLERARAAILALRVPGRDGPVAVDIDVGVLDLRDLPASARAETVVEAGRRSVREPHARTA